MTFMRWHISALILKTLNYEKSIRLRYIRIDSNFCDCLMRTQKETTNHASPMEIKVVASSMQALKKSLLNYHIVVDN